MEDVNNLQFGVLNVLLHIGILGLFSQLMQ